LYALRRRQAHSVSAGSAGTALDNLGQVPSDFLQGAFQSPRVFDAVHSGVRDQFERPLIRIDRVVAAAGKTTELEPPDTPALPVAFSPTRVQWERGSRASANHGARRRSMAGFTPRRLRERRSRCAGASTAHRSGGETANALRKSDASHEMGPHILAFRASIVISSNSS
jgi:hypothetical protein